MSEIDNYPESNEKAVFDELISYDSDYDVGIHDFEEMIRRQRINIFKEQSKSNASDAIDEMWGFSKADRLQNKVDNTWEFYDSLATVSGRVFVINYGEGVNIPDDWERIDGEIREDGLVEYMVDSTQLISAGVTVNTDIDNETILSEPAFSYKFSLPDDTLGLPVIVAFPQDLTKHTYNVLSTKEAERRLFRDYPEQVEIIETLMKEGASNIPQLTKRLEMLVRKLQSPLQQSDEFRSSAEIYVNRRVNFNSALPYYITIKNAIGISHETADWDMPDDDDIVEYSLNAPLSLMAMAPMIRFIHRDNEIIAQIIAQNYSEDGGDEPDIFLVDVDNIEQFKPTFSTHRLGERALRSQYIENSIAETKGLIIEDDDIPHTFNTPIIATLINNFREEQKYIEGKPQHVVRAEERMKQLDGLLLELNELQKHIYSTEDEARLAAQAILEKKIRPLFQDILDNKSILEISGSGVLIPNTISRVNKNTESSLAEMQLTYTTDTQNMLRHLGPAEVALGIPDEVSFELVKADYPDDVELGYSIRPYVLARLESKQQSLLNLNGRELVNNIMVEHAVVALDGSASLIDTMLARYNNLRTTMQSVSEQYARHPITTRLNRLRGALGTSGELIYSDFKNLNNPEIIRSVGRTMSHMEQTHLPLGRVIEAMEAMFLHRTIDVSGELLVRQNGSFRTITNEQDSGDNQLIGKVIDIDVSNGRTMFVVQTDATDNIYFAPLDSIHTLRF